MNQYSVEQKLVPGPYPEIRIITNISKFAEDNKMIDTISINRTIANWEGYGADSVKPLIAYFLGMTESLNYNVWDKQDHIINDELYGFIHMIEEEDKEIYILELALCKNYEHAEEILKSKISNDNDAYKYWIFLYGPNTNENVLSLLHNKCKFIIMIEALPINVITKGAASEYDKYIAFVTKIETKDSKENE